ncbi:MAG: hypothetical protein E7019_02980 [Alphaproteobacteria bacterium]|nr:hypothetical protein [Alphaproteobacteria bacterium]
MIKIAHYEVYVDKGNGWRLQDRFAAEHRHEAFSIAKELEAEKHKVKIIKEIFDVQDSSYQETVEYVSNLGGIGKGQKKQYNWSSEVEEEAFVAPEIQTMRSRTSISGTIIKLMILIIVSLVFANLFVSLLFPLLEIFISEENSRPVLFGVFFVVFLAMSVPLLLKNLPWYIFVNNKNIQPTVKEEKFFTKAESLIQAYNINSSKEPITVSAYPEAPLEYKQYLISFLSELLSHLDTQVAMQNRYSRFGLKLLAFGGCLELARYSGLTMSETNSILYDGIKIIDGDKADLEAFYEAKKTYQDNKIAIFLTGVGANLMSQVINGLPISDNLLNNAFNKWIAQDKDPKTEPRANTEEPKEQAPTVEDGDVLKTVQVSLKSDLKFMDSSEPNQEQIASEVSSQIRNIVYSLQNKYQGSDVIEAKGITSVKFIKANKAIKFAEEFLKDISIYHDEQSDENLLMRNCVAIRAYKEDRDPNLDNHLLDMFDHIYNNEIVADKETKDALEEKGYNFEFIGEKPFKSSGNEEELYKLIV